MSPGVPTQALNPRPAAPGTASLDAALLAELVELERGALRRTLHPLAHRAGGRVWDGDQPLLDFSANDYLGLASDPAVVQAATDALHTAGVGAAAARLISGHHVLHEALEVAIARFLRVDAALLFPAGYMANIGAIPALAGRGDVIYADRLNHASLVDGCRLARADLVRIPHADLEALEHHLARSGARYRRRMIVIEGLYSMDGDLYPLDAVVALARRFDAWIYLDDAHGVGVLGATGRGAPEHWGVMGEIAVHVGTLGKAFGAAGAFVAGSGPLIQYLCNRARPFVYTTGTPPAIAAAALAALAIADQDAERRTRVRAHARRLRAGLTALGRTPVGPADGHIVSVVLGTNEATLATAATLRDAGVLVGAVRPPTVPPGTARLRLTVSAAHTMADIDGLVRALGVALPPA